MLADLEKASMSWFFLAVVQWGGKEPTHTLPPYI